MKQGIEVAVRANDKGAAFEEVLFMFLHIDTCPREGPYYMQLRYNRSLSLIVTIYSTQFHVHAEHEISRQREHGMRVDIRCGVGESLSVGSLPMTKATNSTT